MTEAASAVPTVSVLMTIYNAEPYLRVSIDSLLAQTYRDWELVAVEHGSTDGSAATLTTYDDPRIRVITLPANIGRTPALRLAFEHARGRYMAVQDADDVAHPQRFQREVEVLDECPEVLMVGSWAVFIDEKGTELNTWEPPTDRDQLHDALGWENPIVHSSALYRRDAALAAGGYPEQFAVAQDFALILALATRGRLAMIGDYLCKIRLASTSVLRSLHYRVDTIADAHHLFKEIAASLPLSARGRRLNRAVVAAYAVKGGLERLRAGRVAEGLGIILGAIVRSPSVLWNNGLFRRWVGTHHPFMHRRSHAR